MCCSSLCIFCVCWWCIINTALIQKPQMLTIVFVCLKMCVTFFLLSFSWQPFITHHHIHQTNTQQHEFTHIHLSFLHKCHIFHKKQTAEMLVKWEGCTWWFHWSLLKSIKAWKILKWRRITTCETHYTMIILPIKNSYRSWIKDTTYRTHIIMDIKPNQHTVNIPLVSWITQIQWNNYVHYLFTPIFSEIHK